MEDNQLVQYIIETREDVATIKKHVFNGLTTKVDELHSLVMSHPKVCPFVNWLDAHPDMSLQAEEARKKEAKKFSTFMGAIKDILVIATGSVGFILTIKAVIEGVK